MTLYDLKVVFKEFIFELSKIDDFNESNIEIVFKNILEKYNLKMKKLAISSRVLLTGVDKSPSVFEIMSILGKDLSLCRLNNYQLFLKD